LEGVNLGLEKNHVVGGRKHRGQQITRTSRRSDLFSCNKCQPCTDVGRAFGVFPDYAPLSGAEGINDASSSVHLTLKYRKNKDSIPA